MVTLVMLSILIVFCAIGTVTFLLLALSADEPKQNPMWLGFAVSFFFGIFSVASLLNVHTPYIYEDIDGRIIVKAHDGIPVFFSVDDGLDPKDYPKKPFYYTKNSASTTSDFVTARSNFLGIYSDLVVYKRATPIFDTNFDIVNGQVTSYTGNKDVIKIPYGVEKIGYGAFSGNRAITRAEIPATVAAVASYAFYNCPAMKYALIPANVEDIGEYAFGYVKNSRNTPEKVNGFVIRCVQGSAGDEYALSNGFTPSYI